MNRLQLSIIKWLRDHEETILVFFRNWSRYFSFMYFHKVTDTAAVLINAWSSWLNILRVCPSPWINTQVTSKTSTASTSPLNMKPPRAFVLFRTGLIKFPTSYLNFTWRKRDAIGIGSSIICSDIWHKYHEWYFEIVNFEFETILKYHEWYLRQISRTDHDIICLYTTTRKGFVIFICRYFKLSWNTTALS